MIIIITGTPGTGKTTLAKRLAKEMGWEYLDVNRIIGQFKLKEGYDKKRKCFIVDENKLAKAVMEYVRAKKNKLKSGKAELKKDCNLIIDSHLSHFISKKFADLCIVTKCKLKTLARRLKRKGYSKLKIRENLDAEIFDVCYNEAVKAGHRVVVADTDRGVRECMEEIKRAVSDVGY